jgi:transcription initiation factor TFIIIB Brf1 subunit/transcription initiation factor TFIIB
MTDAPALTRAPHVLPDICARLSEPVPERTRTFARRVCERYDSLDGEALDRAPSCIAAGALYLAIRLHQIECSQQAVAQAAEVSTVTTRRTYQELACHAGVATEAQRGIDFQAPSTFPAWVCEHMNSHMEGRADD